MSVQQMHRGNWVSQRLVAMTGAPAVVLGGLSFVSPYFLIGAVPLLLACGYLAYARHRFSPRGGNVQGQIQDLVMERVTWDGRGTVLDVGCGDGRMAIQLAQRFPGAQVTGIDYWGGMWEYSCQACEANARDAGVADRVTFQKASAARLPFEDGAFDLVISNMVFHEVKEVTDKTLVVQEALRVLREGGSFVFQDLFRVTQFYGRIDDLLRVLREGGVSRVDFVDTSASSFIPAPLRLPFMAGSIGMIHGVK